MALPPTMRSVVGVPIPRQPLPKKMPAVNAPSTATIDTTNNLINRQITTQPSTSTTNARNTADNAMTQYASWNPGTFNQMTPVDTSRTEQLYGAANQQVQGLQATPYEAVGPTDQTRTRALLGSALGSVGGLSSMNPGGSVVPSSFALNLPDRAKLAADAYSLIQERAQPQFAQDLRAVGQKAAALGRVGSGLTTNELGDVATLHDRTLDQARRDLATQAAGQTVADKIAEGQLNLQYGTAADAGRNAAFRNALDLNNTRFGQLTNLAGMENQLAGQRRSDELTERDARIAAGDRQNALGMARAAANRTYGSDLYGLGSDAYARARDERNAASDFDQRSFDNRRSIFGDTAGYARDLYNQDAQSADELRGERAYQYGLSRDAQRDAINQYGAQEDQYNTGFDQGRTLFGLGYGMDPSGVYTQQAGNAQGSADAATAGVGDLLGSYFNYRNGQNRPPGPRGTILPDSSGYV